MEQTVLSQSEIDSLLEAMNSGEISEEILEEPNQPKVKPYDFRRPVRLSKEYLSTISMVLEDFAKISVNQLSSKLRSPVDMSMVSIEQVSFDEFVHSVPKFTLLGTMTSEPQSGVQIIEINSSIAMRMVEILCGYDSGSRFKEDTGKTSFTEIELAILDDMINVFANSFQNVWRDIIDLNTKVDSVNTNPQLLQSMSPNEPVVLATFNISLSETSTFVNLCIPYVFFEDILDKLSFRNWFHEGKEAGELDHERFSKNLQPVPVELVTLLGQSEISIEDFLDMEQGDIVQLSNKTSQPLTMYVEDKPYFKVKPGYVDDSLAVEVLQFIGGETPDE